MSKNTDVSAADGNVVEEAVEAVVEAVEIVDEDVEEIVARMYVSELTVDEFRQLMNEVLDERKPQRKVVSTANVPDGYTLSIASASKLFGFGSMRVRAMCRDGKFGEDGAVKINGRWHIRPEAIAEYVKASKIVKTTKAATKTEAAAKKARKAVRSEAKAVKAAAANEEAKAIKVKLQAIEAKHAAEDALDLDELDLDDGESEEAVEIDAEVE